MREIEERRPKPEIELRAGPVCGVQLARREDDDRRTLLDLPPTTHSRMRDRDVATRFPCKICAPYRGLELYSLRVEEWGVRALYRCAVSSHRRCEDRPGMVCVIGFDETHVYLSDTLVSNRFPLPLPFLEA